MTLNTDPEYLAGLVHELRSLPHETEWVEFKTNLNNPQEIGEYVLHCRTVQQSMVNHLRILLGDRGQYTCNRRDRFLAT